MHAPCSNYRSILSSGSYYLEDFDYRSILVDSGIIVHWRVQMTRHDQSVSEGEAGGMVAVRGHQMRDDRSGQRKSPHRCPTVLQRREATAHQDQNLG